MAEEIKQEGLQPQGAEVVDKSDGLDGSDKVDTSGSDRKIKTYREMIDTLEPQETVEQRRKRERREKSARIISAVSDGLSALGNLYFTSQYAPNMYSHERGSQLTAQNAAVERARKEREANRDAHFRLALSLGDAENERAKTVREFEAEQERRKLAREEAKRREEAAKAERALDSFREGKAKAEQSYWEYKSEGEKAVAANAPELQQAKVKSEEARGESYRSSARAHDRSNPQVVHHFNGKTYPKDSKDYEKDVREAARQYNERHGRWVERVTQQGTKVQEWQADEGFTRIETDYKKGEYGDIVPRKAEEYAGEVETALAAERAAATKRSKGAGYGGQKGKGTGY